MTIKRPRPPLLRTVTLTAKVFDELKRAAKADEPCPKNIDLAATVGASHADVCAKIIQTLRAALFIRVEFRSGLRRIHIVGTEYATDWSEVRVVNPDAPRSDPTHVPVGMNEAAIAARVAADQAALIEMREKHLRDEQRRYGFATRGRLVGVETAA